MELNTQEVHLSHYWNIIYKRWKIALSIFVVVMAGALLASYLSKPLYRSAITIQIERENPNQLTMEDLFGIAADEQEFLQTQYIVLKSRELAFRVIDDHKLLSDPDFYPPGIKGKSKEEIEKIKSSVADGLLAQVTVNPIRNTSIAEIAYVGPTPKLALKIAEGWGISYMRLNVARKFETVRQANEFIASQIGQVKLDLDRARGQLQKYGASKDIVSVDSNNNENITVQRLLAVSTDYANAQNDRIARQSELNALLRAAPETVAGNDALVVQLTGQISALNREYNQKLGVFKPDHPTMQTLKQQLDKARQERATAVLNAFANARGAAQDAVNAAMARENSMRSAVEQQKRETQQQSVDAVTYVDIRTEIETKQALLAQLQRQLNETEVTARLRGSNTSNVHWVDHAQLPAGRFNETMKKNLQNALPLGILLGLATIFFLEYLDRSVKSPEELERVTGFASLGVIPASSSFDDRAARYGEDKAAAKLRAVDDDARGIDLLPHTDSRSAISEAYRAFRTSLLLASANSPKVMVVTSSFAREGKTTTSINLAVVLAQMGKPVLLIDADLRRPRLHRVFRGAKNVGLVNYLAANAPLEQIVQPTEVPNLFTILAGPIPPNPSELLGSDRMKVLIQEIRSRYAFVIFDSPPVLAVADAIVLSAGADGVILCVHGGRTPRELVARSAERLRQSKIPVLGAILNNVDLHQYGYTYKKSYYEYYQPDDEKAARRARKTV
jgi:capsular exopolysaccharide synthesis family protein